MSSDDWRFFRRFVLWSSLIGLVYTAMDSRNYAERGRGYTPPQYADCELTWLGRYCRGEVESDSRYAGDSRREW